MKLVDSARMQAIDRTAQEEYGIPSLVLMESAGLLAWIEVERIIGALGGSIGPSPHLCVVAGKGNNGGDALVVARYAAGSGRAVSVVLATSESELGEQASIHARIVRSLGVPVVEWPTKEAQAREALAGAALIVDGLAGTGIRGALRDPLDAICASVNEAPAPVAAIDAPSGLGDEWEPGMPLVRARWTLAMGLPTIALFSPDARPSCGTIIRVAVSFPRELIEADDIPGALMTPDMLPGIIPPLASEDYKHRRGVVAVFAGRVGTTGAAVLAAHGAQRCRAGLVTICTDEDAYVVVASSVTSIMVRQLPEPSATPAPDALDALFATHEPDALVIGPGWGLDGREKLFRALLARSPGGCIDADGLNLLAGLDEWPELHENWVLTPHPGELARMLDRSGATVKASLIDAARELARASGAVVLAKSNVVVAAHPDGRFAVIDGGNPALGTGGTGDVLAGAVAGLIAGGLGGWDAARGAALAHQMAGARLRERAGVFLAEELPAELGRVVDVGRTTER